MSGFNTRDFLDELDNVEESHGFVPTPLPRGQYPGQVEKEVSRGISKNGVPNITYLVRVTEGPFGPNSSGEGGRTFLHQIYLGASDVTTDKEGNTINRSDEEVQKKRKSALGLIKGIWKSLGCDYNNPTNLDEDDEGYIYERLGVDNLIGRSAMYTLNVKNDRNEVQAIHNMEDTKNGIGNWRDKVLPKQLRGSTSGGLL